MWDPWHQLPHPPRKRNTIMTAQLLCATAWHSAQSTCLQQRLAPPNCTPAQPHGPSISTACTTHQQHGGNLPQPAAPSL